MFTRTRGQRSPSLASRPAVRLVGRLAMLLLGVALASEAVAQVQAGRLVGTVSDPDDAVVPGATVTVTRAGTNVSRTVVTNATGEYVVTPLDPGAYDVTVTLSGFETVVQQGVRLEPGRYAVRVDVQLTLGRTTDTVEVTAGAPLLDTETATMGQTIHNEAVVDLPLNGRGFQQLARLVPGALNTGATGNVLPIRPERINENTISGVRGSQITFLLDGVDVTEQHQGGTNVVPSIDAIQEFSVQQNPYSAEYARAGGFFNIALKSGTNAFRGTAFEFLRNSTLDARDFFALERQPLKRNQFGGNLGGPLIKDKVFFFASYEGSRERAGLTFNNTVPTLAEREGDFSDSDTTIFDPLTTRPDPNDPSGTIRDPFPNNVIPPDRLSPHARFFLPFIAEPNAGPDQAVFSPTRVLDRDQLQVRIDYEVTPRHKLFARMSHFDNRQEEPNGHPALETASLNADAQDYAVALTSTLRPSLINEFRFNALPSTIALAPYLDGTDFVNDAGIAGFENTLPRGGAGSFPDLRFSDIEDVNGTAFDQRPKTQDRSTFELTNNVTWVTGRHIAKFGVKMRRFEWLGTDGTEHRGVFNHSGINTENPASPEDTGRAFADFLLGIPSSVSRGFPGDPFGGHGTYWHFFVQDDWKVLDRVTLSLGLRYEYSPWLLGENGQLGTFDPGSDRPLILASETDQINLDAQPGTRNAFPNFADLIQTSSQAGLPIQITENDNNQWAPRIGLAWRPLDERTVVRAGYGIFYEAEQSDGRVNLNVPPFAVRETQFNTRGAVPNRTLADFFQGAALGSGASTPGINPSSLTARQGNNQHWNLSIQRQVGGSQMVEIAYVGNKGSNLQSRTDINIPQPGPGSIQDRRPFPRFAGINFFDDTGSTVYHALQAKWEQRPSAGLWYLVSYTYSKALETFPTPAVGGTFAMEKRVSNLSVPHNFSLNFSYELPVGRDRRFLSAASPLVDHLLGGWQLSGFINLHSGFAFTPTAGRDVANIGVGDQRPNRVGSGTLDNPTLDRYFDLDAFAVPDDFTFGDSGSGILRGDGFQGFDFALMKNFALAGGRRLQFRAEAFNLPNHASFDNPESDILSQNAGRVLGTRSSTRRIQLGLKLFF
ncbi:MAG: TonB-dependent receptor domain-containing protein [Vicinamibacteraceae bacterium]